MSRIEELEKRLAADPNSRMFVQLAEEYRKAGLLEQAIEVCESGLKKHPQYPSARVALGRALLESGTFDRAREEFESVLKAVPDNIVANKFLAETYQRLGRLEEALKKYRVAKTLAPEDAELDGRIQEVEREISGGASPIPPTPTPSAATQAPAVAPPEAPPVPPAAPAPARPAPFPPPSVAPAASPAPSADLDDETYVDDEPTRIMEELPPIPLVEVDEPMILETRDYVPPPREESVPSAPAPANPPRTTAPAAPAFPEPPAFAEIEAEAVFEPEFGVPTIDAEPEPVAPPPPKPAPPPPAAPIAPAAPARPVAAPAPMPTVPRQRESEIETPTIAEIYANQGHLDQAIAVYRKILERSPGELQYRNRIEELQMLATASSGPTPASARGSGPGSSDSRERTVQVLEQWLAAIRKSKGAR